MANFCLVIQYDGTRYNGWQRQGNTPDTIQEKPGKYSGASLRRTRRFKWLRQDRRRRTCASPDRQLPHTAHPKPLFLPRSSRLFQSLSAPRYPCAFCRKNAPDRFHARLSASSKVYEYRIDCGEIARVFDRKYLYRIEEPLNLEKMQDAAALMIGTHDFKSFCSNRHMKNRLCAQFTIFHLQNRRESCISATAETDSSTIWYAL